MRALPSTRKGTIGMEETILVIFILAVIFLLIIFVYYKYQIADIETSGDELSEQEALVQLASITKYPELRCNVANCIDMLKAVAFKSLSQKNINYYRSTFGQKTLKIEQLYPEPTSEAECTAKEFNQIDYPNNCKYWVIYEQKPSNFRSKKITSVPVSLYFPDKEEYHLGNLVIEVYR